METFMMLLMTCSVITSLTTEAIKKILDEHNKKYSANLLASVISVVLAVGIGVAYMVIRQIAFTPQIGVYMVALIVFSFLCATLGYDKVMQTIGQLRK